MSRQQTFDGPTLEAALAQVTETLGPDASIVRAEKVRSGGVGGFFCRERFEITVDEVDGIDVDDIDLGDIDVGSPLAAPEPAAPPSILDLAERVNDEEAELVPPLPRVSTDTPDFRAVMRRVAADAGIAVDEQPATGPAWVVPEPAVVATVEPPTPATTDALRRLGLPPALVPADGDDSVAVRLLRRLETLRVVPPLPTTGGTVVAVIGGRRDAVALASDLALELGGDADDVVVASPRRSSGPDTITSATAAADHRRSWRRRPRPTVVALVAPAVRDTAWAGRVLEALEPSAVWATVAADRKTDDVAAWLDALAPLDALAVDGVERTETPAAVLGFGVPVARVDGRRASPAGWTALLVDRLTA